VEETGIPGENHRPDILDVFAKYILFIFIEISGFCTMFRGVVVDVIVW
jgi:hypothetical protein